jgi:ATP-binding cassette subfamily C (CFTR/MRP) protein 1
LQRGDIVGKFDSQEELHISINYLLTNSRYLAVFLETTGNFVVFFAFLFAVLYSDNLTTGMVGLALSYALQITHGLNWLVDTTSNVENNLVAVERLKEYGEISQVSPNIWDLDLAWLNS